MKLKQNGHDNTTVITNSNLFLSAVLLMAIALFVFETLRVAASRPRPQPPQPPQREARFEPAFVNGQRPMRPPWMRQDSAAADRAPLAEARRKARIEARLAESRK